jgi:hypothetical protein
MNTLPPSLPYLNYLPFYVAIDGTTGYLCGQVSQVNPILMASIFAIRALADTLFYQLTNFTLKGKDLQSQRIFLVSTAVINMTFLIALRELNLIGRLFSCLLGLAVIGTLIHRVGYIQDREQRLRHQEVALD